MTTDITTVIFDAGGVLHESNSALQNDLISELGISEESLSNIEAEFLSLLGAGKIDEATFWQKVQDKHNIRQVHVDENLLGRAFNDDLVPFSEVRNIVVQLRHVGIKTAVLSNTIEPHAKALRTAGLYNDFDAVLLSHEIGLRKPGRKIYEYALKVLQSEPKKTIFIDDSPKNIEAARKIGIHSILFQNPTQLKNELTQLIPKL